ncbi:MAG: filamentous hemagglutinin N-terminal domain-containing protein [Scytonematopsis contorta HA4267-MV1]|jgi:filamentous hemagglutinin family protein|nr:filamentous hemagglutinin N-terminal domain-containing protein [Scytonematopsis contorta HA4267-MV1]
MGLSKSVFLSFCITAFGSLLPTSNAFGQIVPDNTLPMNSSVVPGCTICTIDGGTIRGVNLFHSFGQFSVPNGGAALFNNNPSIENIFTRVTGGSQSDIDGLIRTNGNASLFLLNPSGIVFGPNARLDIRGSFTATTSESFIFFDGSEFSAVDPQDPPLLTINVAPGLQYGAIQEFSYIESTANLSAGQDLVLVADELYLQGTLQSGRDLNLFGGRFINSPQGLTIRAGGNVTFDFYQDEDDFYQDDFYQDDFYYEGASLHILAGGSVNIPGDIYIDGVSEKNGLEETIVLSDGSSEFINGKSEPIVDIRAGVKPEAIGNSINNTSTPINADINIGSVDFVNEPGKVLLTNLYQPNVLLSGGNIEVARINTSTIFSSGNAGKVIVESRGNFSSTADINTSARNGQGGDINIRALGSVMFDDLEVRSTSSESGNAGNITINADSLFLNNGAQIITISEQYSTGNAGKITINLRDTLWMTGNSSNPFRIHEPPIPSAIFSLADFHSTGNGGDVFINTGSLVMTDGSEILANNFGSGINTKAGNITIRATGNISLDGYRIRSGDVPATSIGSNLFTLSPEASGVNKKAGIIDIKAANLAITNGANLSSQVSGYSDGQGGNIKLDIAGNVFISGAKPFEYVDINSINSGIFTSTQKNSTGNGGTIELKANTLTIADRGTISAQTDNPGDGGKISLNTNNLVVEDNAKITVTTSTIGNAGSITINTNNLNLNNKGEILATTSGQGNAGDIIINALRSLSLNDNAQISAGTSAGGKGGNIDISTRELVVTNGGKLSANTTRQGDAGNIEIKADNGSVRITGLGSGFSTQTDSDSGKGGNIFVTTDNFNIANAAQLNATTTAAAPGGSITVNAKEFSASNAGQLRTTTPGSGKAGDININATNSLSLSDSDTGLFADTNGGQGGNISVKTNIFNLTNAAQLNAATTASSPGGSITVNANDFNINSGGQLRTTTSGSGKAGDININAANSLSLSDSDTGLFADTTSDGQGGNISVKTNTFNLANAAQLNAATRASAPGGSIMVNANGFNINSGGQLRTTTFGSGKAGDININATNNINLSDAKTGLFADTNGGQGGNISVKTNTFNLTNAAQLNAATRASAPGGSIIVNANDFNVNSGGQLRTTTSGSGKAGDININAANNINLSGAKTGLFADTSGGQGGNISVKTNTFNLTNAAQLNAATRASSPGGSITVNSNDFNVNSGGQLRTTTSGSGKAGDININAANSLSLSDSDTGLFADTSGGQGGIISVKTNTFNLANTAQLNATTTASSPGGSITVNANDFNVNSGGQLRTTTSGSGKAGDINITNINNLLLAGNNTGLFADTDNKSTGDGGSIFVEAKNILLENTAGIAVGSRGTGTGGAIQIQAGAFTLNNRGSLSAETASSQGGDINLLIQDLLWLRQNSLISTTAGTAASGGNGGNISITAPFIIGFPQENSDIRANAFTGNGGKVNITAQGIIGMSFQPKETPNSDITASSQFGASGEVILNTPNVDPSRGLANLPANLSDPSSQIAQGCSSGGQATSQGSRFIVTGRSGLPSNPNELFTGRNILVELYQPVESSTKKYNSSQATSSTSDDQSTASEVVEAQGWVVDKNGNVFLVASVPNLMPGHPAIKPVACPP